MWNLTTDVTILWGSASHSKRPCIGTLFDSPTEPNSGVITAQIQTWQWTGLQMILELSLPSHLWLQNPLQLRPWTSWRKGIPSVSQLNSSITEWTSMTKWFVLYYYDWTGSLAGVGIWSMLALKLQLGLI